MNKFVEGALARLASQDGVRETKVAGKANNMGRAVEMYQHSVGIPPGSAWCAAFVYWGISEEAKARQIEVPFLRSGYCPAIHAWAKSAGVARSTPEVGDAFLRLLQYPEGIFASHIGIVTKVNANGTFETIEGNTNAGLSNEGDGVYRRTRPINSDYVFVRWALLLPVPVTEPPTFALMQNGRRVCDMPVVAGRSLCPLRDWATLRGLSIAWDEDTQTVSLNNKPVHGHVSLIDGKAYAPISELVQGTELRLSVDSKARTVTLAT